MFVEDSQITPKLILRGHPGWINDVTISSDNKRVVTVGKVKYITSIKITYFN